MLSTLFESFKAANTELSLRLKRGFLDLEAELFRLRKSGTPLKISGCADLRRSLWPWRGGFKIFFLFSEVFYGMLSKLEMTEICENPL